MDGCRLLSLPPSLNLSPTPAGGNGGDLRGSDAVTGPPPQATTGLSGEDLHVPREPRERAISVDHYVEAGGSVEEDTRGRIGGRAAEGEAAGFAGRSPIPSSHPRPPPPVLLKLLCRRQKGTSSKGWHHDGGRARVCGRATVWRGGVTREVAVDAAGRQPRRRAGRRSGSEAVSGSTFPSTPRTAPLISHGATLGSTAACRIAITTRYGRAGERRGVSREAGGGRLARGPCGARPTGRVVYALGATGIPCCYVPPH